jgi:hypothetical protein
MCCRKWCVVGLDAAGDCVVGGDLEGGLEYDLCLKWGGVGWGGGETGVC